MFENMFSVISHKKMQIDIIPVRMAVVKNITNVGNDQWSLYINDGNLNRCIYYANSRDITNTN